MDGYIFLNDHETFSGLNGALFINEDNGAFDLQKLLQRVAADAPHLLKECEVECPESVLDELEEPQECNHERTRMDDGISSCLDCGDRLDTDADDVGRGFN